MEEFEVLTVRDLDFEDDRGKEVSGMQLWLINSTDVESWNGWEVSKLWIPTGSEFEDVVCELVRGDKVLIEFNRRGRPKTIAKVS